MKILKCLLMIVTAPVVLVLTLFVWLCTGLIYISGLVLGLLSTVGMFIFLKPGLIWKLTEEWKSYRADEPSEFYLKATKIGGALFALFGIIMIMLPFILE